MSVVLWQSGLDEKWWADSMECFTYLRNVQDLLSDGKTQYERHFEKPSDSFMDNGCILSDFFTRSVKAPPIWSESFIWNIPRIRTNVGENLQRCVDMECTMTGTHVIRIVNCTCAMVNR